MVYVWFTKDCVYSEYQYRTELIFYFRTYTKYIVTIQYIYICHVWYMLHSDNSYACLRDNISVCIFFKENNKTRTRTHAYTHIHAHTTITYTLSLTYTHVRTRTRTHDNTIQSLSLSHTHTYARMHARTHKHTHTHIWYRYTCLAFSKLYSCFKK